MTLNFKLILKLELGDYGLAVNHHCAFVETRNEYITFRVAFRESRKWFELGSTNFKVGPSMEEE